MGWAFDKLGWEEVIHCIAPDNAGSIAVAERLGSSNRGPGRMPPPFETMIIDIWGQTRAQWERRSG
jgi:RimJ/RimL family protein N-acetyltransferase